MTLLVSVLVLGAVTIVVGAGMAIRGIEEIDLSKSTVQTAETLAIADSCLDHALIELKRTPSIFTGTVLNVGDGQCEVSVIGTGDYRTVISTGSLLQWTREIYSEITLSGSFVIQTKWRHGTPIFNSSSAISSSTPSSDSSSTSIPSSDSSSSEPLPSSSPPSSDSSSTIPSSSPPSSDSSSAIPSSSSSEMPSASSSDSSFSYSDSSSSDSSFSYSDSSTSYSDFSSSY